MGKYDTEALVADLIGIAKDAEKQMISHSADVITKMLAEATVKLVAEILVSDLSETRKAVAIDTVNRFLELFREAGKKK